MNRSISKQLTLMDNRSSCTVPPIVHDKFSFDN